MTAARWHINELQPDNATNHPWAVHTFLILASQSPQDAPAATFHADTLLHACQIKLGTPDLVSALILLDAANTLAAMLNPPPSPTGEVPAKRAEGVQREPEA